MQKKKNAFLAEVCGAMNIACFTAARFEMERVLGRLTTCMAEAARAASMHLVMVAPLATMEQVETFVVSVLL